MSDNTKPEGYIFGRPTKYLPEYCEQVIELGKQGKSKTQIACVIGVKRQTLDDWAKANPHFSDALTRAKEESQAWFEDKGQIGLETPGFNSSLWAKQVSCRFPDDYREKQEIKHSGEIGAPHFTFEIVSPKKSDEDTDS